MLKPLNHIFLLKCIRRNGFRKGCSFEKSKNVSYKCWRTNVVKRLIKCLFLRNSVWFCCIWVISTLKLFRYKPKLPHTHTHTHTAHWCDNSNRLESYSAIKVIYNTLFTINKLTMRFVVKYMCNLCVVTSLCFEWPYNVRAENNISV